MRRREIVYATVLTIAGVCTAIGLFGRWLDSATTFSGQSR